MQLAPEDALRINVLLSNKPLAVRINESRNVLDGLLPDRQISIQLNPSGAPDQYLKAVRSVLSEYALGTPGGYPLYLQRWTRMGTMRDESLENLLLLGEPTAVFAVVCAQGLTDELARRAWWASEEAENARRMLQTQAVVQGETGKVLARYLIEFLPFESDSEKITESVRMALQPGLLSTDEVATLWKKSARKGANLVGFLQARSDDLPQDGQALSLSPEVVGVLERLHGDGNPLAQLLVWISGAAGQVFLETLLRVLSKPNSQDVVEAALNALADRLAAARPEGDPDLDWDTLVMESEASLDEFEPAARCLKECAALQARVLALRILAGARYGVLRPVFKKSDAIGSLMRRQLEPVLEPLMARIELLRRPL